ncbi:MAG: helix-turn-helix transcriptional regulator [Lachnospiraceae bacterium]|nr:helix-turn-helix transcriptional regulator [Lachnospiraceae bacterium]
MKLERLKELRLKKQLTQQEISDSLNIQREVYRRYESGQRSIPLELLIRIADYYDVSIDYITNRDKYVIK